MHAVNGEPSSLRCHECQGDLTREDRFCPWCGAPRATVRRRVQPVAPREARPVASPPEGRGWTRSSAAVVGTLAGLLVVALVGIAAIYFGLRDRAATERGAAQEHLERGAAYLQSGDVELAAAELELAVRLAPDLTEAETLLSEARTRVAGMATPTSQPTAVPEAPVSSLYADLVDAHGRGDWEWVWELADRIREIDATYRASEVNGMLFDAYVASGRDLVEQDRLPEAVRMFDRALELRPGDAALAEERLLAGSYMDGLARWNADWPGAIEKLRSVYLRDPAYRDVRAKLQEALEAYGDSLAAKGEWCTAQRQYAAALEILDSSLITSKHSDARQRCAAGEGPLEVTPGATAAPGTFAGRLVEQTGIGDGKMIIRGAVLDADGKGMAGVRVRIAAFDWSSVAITDGNGTFAFDGLSNEVVYTLTLPDQAAQSLDVPGEFGKMTWVEFRRVGS